MDDTRLMCLCLFMHINDTQSNLSKRPPPNSDHIPTPTTILKYKFRFKFDCTSIQNALWHFQNRVKTALSNHKWMLPITWKIVGKIPGYFSDNVITLAMSDYIKWLSQEEEDVLTTLTQFYKINFVSERYNMAARYVSSWSWSNLMPKLIAFWRNFEILFIALPRGNFLLILNHMNNYTFVVAFQGFRHANEFILGYFNGSIMS